MITHTLAQQDEDAGELDEAELDEAELDEAELDEMVEGMAFIAHDEPTEIAQPGKESLDLPPPAVASERATLLRPLRPSPPMWRNQLHASPGQFGIQSVRHVTEDQCCPRAAISSVRGTR